METKNRINKNHLNLVALFIIFSIGLLHLFCTIPASAHCDAYDGPVIKDAIKALETNNVIPILKWISKEHETEIISLFNKTCALKSGDEVVYKIVEKHFFETLVRLHRETEGEPFTGLKPAGEIKKIIQLSDHAIESNNIDDMLDRLNNHLREVVQEKFNKVAGLYEVKDLSAEKGREYVSAYVDYTHTLVAIEGILENGHTHSSTHD